MILFHHQHPQEMHINQNSVPVVSFLFSFFMCINVLFFCGESEHDFNFKDLCRTIPEYVVKQSSSVLKENIFQYHSSFSFAFPSFDTANKQYQKYCVKLSLRTQNTFLLYRDGYKDLHRQRSLVPSPREQQDMDQLHPL